MFPLIQFSYFSCRAPWPETKQLNIRAGENCFHAPFFISPQLPSLALTPRSQKPGLVDSSESQPEFVSADEFSVTCGCDGGTNTITSSSSPGAGSVMRTTAPTDQPITSETGDGQRSAVENTRGRFVRMAVSVGAVVLVCPWSCLCLPRQSSLLSMCVGNSTPLRFTRRHRCHVFSVCVYMTCVSAPKHNTI